MTTNNVLPQAPDPGSLESAIGSAGLGIWDVTLSDPWMVVLDNRCRELFGISKTDDVRFDNVLQYVHPSDRELVQAAVQGGLDTSKDGSYDVTFRPVAVDKPGSRWVRAIGKRYVNTLGLPERFSGIAMDVTTEKVATQKLEAAENLAQIAIKGFGIGIFYINLENDHIDYSPAFSVLVTGENRSNLTRNDFVRHIHEDDQKLREAAYKTAARIGDLYYEARTTWIDGSIHWIRTVGTYTFDDAGKPLAFAGTVQDITEQRVRQQAFQEAENRFSLALRRSEAMFRNVTSTSPTGLWMADEKGGLTYLNKTLKDWTGMPYDALLGDGWLAAVITEDRERAAEAFSGAVASLQHYDVEFRIQKGTGEVIWCRAAGDPFYQEDGSYAGYVGFCMNINDVVLNADRLRVSEERLRAIIRQAPVAIGLLNGREMVVETANETILRLWGKDESIIGLPLLEAIPEIRGQDFTRFLQDVYKTGIPYFGNNSFASLVHDGKLKDFYFDFVYHPIRDTADAVTGVMVIAVDVTNQVEARKALEDSERRFRALIEEAPIATTLFRGREQIIEVANEAMIKLWGKDNSVIGLPLSVALPEIVGQPFLDILDNVFTTGKAYHAQEAPAKLLVNGELKSYYFNFTYKPLRNEYGEIYATLNMAIDVTDQVEARKKTEESDLFARSIINNSPVAKMVFIGPDMMISTVNENMLKMLGRNDSIIGKTFMAAMPELVNTPTMDRLGHVLATGETYYQPEEKIEIHVNGAAYTGYYNYIYKALPNLAGEFYGVIFTATEVTDQVLARKKIMETEESLRGAIELAELGTWSVTIATRIVDFSHRLRTWFGFSDNENISIEEAYNNVQQADRHLLMDAMAEVVVSGSRDIYDVEFTVINKVTGLERILHSQGKAFLNEKGEVYKVSGTAQDVTRQRRLQLALEHEVDQRTDELRLLNDQLTATNEELQESNKRLVHSNDELAQYAYVASHDLQEPLRKIRLFSDMLVNQPNLNADNHVLINKIIHSAERMTHLIHDLLEFSRLLKSDMLMRPLNLSDVADVVVNDFELSIAEKNATIIVGNLPVIQAVNLQMNQLFNNLLSNALKFTHPGRSPRITIDAVQISYEEAERYIQKPFPFCNYYRIRFADNGIGFEVEYSEQIFEVFKRLHGRDMYPGTGIGLALCRRIIANHNGQIYAESKAGQGTSFYIILPDRQHNVQSTMPENFTWTSQSKQQV